MNPPGSEIFALFPCGPISFLVLLLRRYYFIGIFTQHFNVPHLNHCINNLTIFKMTLFFYGTVCTQSCTCKSLQTMTFIYIVSDPYIHVLSLQFYSVCYIIMHKSKYLEPNITPINSLFQLLLNLFSETLYIIY